MIGVENVQRKSKIELPIQFEESREVEKKIDTESDRKQGRKEGCKKDSAYQRNVKIEALLRLRIFPYSFPRFAPYRNAMKIEFRYFFSRLEEVGRFLQPPIGFHPVAFVEINNPLQYEPFPNKVLPNCFSK